MRSLANLCQVELAKNFESQGFESPLSSTLSQAQLKKIVDILPVDLPLELAGESIADEEYWRRRCCARWRNLETLPHASSWKQLYFERNLEDALEKFDPAIGSIDDLRRLLTYSRRFVMTIRLRQLPSHLDLSIVFDSMVNSPTGLSIQYSLRNVGMEYDRSLFGMKLADCRTLAKCLEKAETLTYLDLSNNSLDDDKIRMLASGLVENISITHLNLSHNKIADRGVRALAKLLDSNSSITQLELQDNQIHTEGAKSLGRALKANKGLVSLNLRLNRMGDEGCKVVCDSIRGNSTLERLSIAANAAGQETVNALVPVMRLSNSVTELDVSCNNFGASGCELIRRALEMNSSILTLDVRQCGANPDDEVLIAINIESRGILR